MYLQKFPRRRLFTTRTRILETVETHNISETPIERFRPRTALRVGNLATCVPTTRAAQRGYKKNRSVSRVLDFISF